MIYRFKFGKWDHYMIGKVRYGELVRFKLGIYYRPLRNHNEFKKNRMYHVYNYRWQEFE